MLELLPDYDRRRGLKVLAIGAHCDDIDLGCGGTLLALQVGVPRLRISCLTLVAPPDRRLESQRALRALIKPAARGNFAYHDLSDGFLPANYAAAKGLVEQQCVTEKPDLVFCHERDDRHQDHRLLSDIAWSTFRDQLILEYEVVKWDGGLTTPNVYVPLSAVQARRKHAAILRAHRSQAQRDWFNAAAFESLLRLRGLECRAPSGLAEGFHGRKIRLRTGR
jgi:LmbE family N-acetylglucosaminyl deacetylase